MSAIRTSEPDIHVATWIHLKNIERGLQHNPFYMNLECIIELPYDPAMELKSGSQRNISTPMFIAAISTIAKLWKKTKCPSTEKWLKKIWYRHTMEYY